MKRTASVSDRKPVILIVDDTLTGRRAIASSFAQQDYELALASNGQEALALADKLEPDIILLDVVMPGMSGFEVCRQLRAHPSLGEVPILMVTSLTDRAERLEGIASGADDFISKPFDVLELQARVHTITRLNRYRKLKERTRQVVSLKREVTALENKKSHLQKLAMLDDLTKLHNRRSLLMKGREEFNRAKRYKTHLSALMIDVDTFKSINDTLGHKAGNIILKALAEVFRTNLRSMDFPSRLGGDEFFILLPHTSFKSAFCLAERLRVAVAEQEFMINARPLRVTISIGVTALSQDMAQISDLLEAADSALYKAKVNRNFVA